MKNFEAPKNYAEALSRLEKIAERLERGDVGIDDLETIMLESKQLLHYCENRLRAIETNFD